MTAPATNPTVRVSVVIKAYNEARNIGRAIESALAAVARVGGEVVLADSASTDETVAVASRYPIRIVTLARPQERCCGIGPQLGYQHARGDYVYLMDGDVRMLPDFLGQAISWLEDHPEAGGVAGLIVEHNQTGLEYVARTRREGTQTESRTVDTLNGGGLYRRSAIESVGHFSDRNLHSYEEFDLGLRLRAAGWQLWRLAIPAVDHWGHEVPAYTLLKRRWRNRYLFGIGELVRAALGKPHLPALLRDSHELHVYAVAMAWLLLLASVPFWPLSPALRITAFIAIAAAVPGAITLRKRSLQHGVYSVVSWCWHVVALLAGLLQPRVPPATPIDSVVVHDGSTAR